MSINLSPIATSDFVATLTDAATALRYKTNARPAPSLVVQALLQAEKASKQQRLTYPWEALLGDWQLGFTATRKAHFQRETAIGKGFYMPQFIPAQISFHAPPELLAQNLAQGDIRNQVQFGALALKLTGPARYLSKKNLLAFDFTQIQLCLFNRTIYQGAFRGGKAQTEDFDQRSVAELPFFAFFSVTDTWIAARGRGGGLALWVRQP
ncbi:MAG: hypothetical protein KME16_26190 [Scytolyngbya sp. HA4215-MV1]|nr:hypothetical protein [Scytolyngbya sp. HA4215-MV1]